MSHFGTPRLGTRKFSVFYWLVGAGEDVPPADSTLIEYTRRMRSPDDKATQEYLFGVLEERLLAFPGHAELILKR